MARHACDGTSHPRARPTDVIEHGEQAMQNKCRWRTRILAVMALAGWLGGCAAGGADGRESSITTYGTLDVGISHTR
ncbi:hypothetical protein E5S69_22995 [Cupriavidus necator]|nr:hypothetical protein [Cupriavidus necator]